MTTHDGEQFAGGSASSTQADLRVRLLKLDDPAQDFDNADLVLITPFDDVERQAFVNFYEEVIAPAVLRARQSLNQPVNVVVLNPILRGLNVDHESAYRVLHEAEIVIADVTGADLNVISALAMRQCLSKGATIPLLRKRGDDVLPFNISRTVLTAETPDERISAQAAIYTEITAAMSAMPSRGYASPVHMSLTALRLDLRGSQPRADQKPDYKLVSFKPSQQRSGATPPRFEIALGDIRRVTDIDVWVNPENTHMEMARVFEPSISGIIRHLSAKWSEPGERSDDFIRRKLAEATSGDMLPPGAAVMTKCRGDLYENHHVKRVVHVAAVHIQGQGPGAGYRVINDVGVCVANALAAVDDFNDSLIGQGRNRLTSVITPLLGVSTSPHEAFENVLSMLRHSVNHFEARPNSKIKRFVLLAYTGEDRRLIRKALKQVPQLDGASLDTIEDDPDTPKLDLISTDEEGGDDVQA